MLLPPFLKESHNPGTTVCCCSVLSPSELRKLAYLSLASASLSRVERILWKVINMATKFLVRTFATHEGRFLFKG